MPTKDNKTLKYYHGEKSLKAPFTIYADLECLLIKEQSCQNNPNESYNERKAKHVPSGYSLSLICSFDSKENKHNFYRGRDCIEKFCKNLKELGTEIINYEEKDIILLTDKKVSFMKSKKNVTYVIKSFFMIKMKKRNLNFTKKLEIIVIIQENLEELLIPSAI